MISGNKIQFHPFVIRYDIPSLDTEVKKRVRDIIRTKLVTNPDIFGEPLRGTLKLHWKLRVGDYRIVYSIHNDEVNILVIGHRSEVYKIAGQRL